MVEVEEIGVKCNNLECNQIQFLSFECLICGKKFCIEHVGFGKHICKNEGEDARQFTSFERRLVEEKGEKVSVNCSIEGCSKVGVTCRKCDKMLCSEHIYESEHECVVKSRIIIAKGRAQDLRRRYSGGEILSGSKLPEDNKSSKILRKIMIKSKSIGDSSIPVRNRVAVALYVGRDVECLKYVNKELPICIWLNGEKTVGWNLDYISERLKVLREGSNSDTVKDKIKINFSGLILYKNKDIYGKEFSEKKALEMSAEFGKHVLDGESLLLDYGFI
ncbi:uncharacterized protein cubi_03455 [Cryptosporidium ubiquitum]|uniref:AN1-type domain-containing protein n=1 Tax=Cryptosporidium ubiquitum TaxID=857276 RepID=A0A1J4MHD8_9CRYT|nr:uncharacterized protein cubi_03455 [Cryptosporidium ubiquitum]OII73657.1 hypothetical protein cubi_03455 [Cryptosporidium ubiquitum]